MKVKEKSEKVGLKLSIQKTKIMASGPITSWQIDRETVETVADFIFQGSQITADGDCSHEIKRRLLLGRKFMTNLDNMLKMRDISLSIKVRLAKAMVFPVVMYGFQLDFLPMNPSILSSISLWPTNTSAMKKFFTSNTSPMHMTRITTHFPIKHPPTNIRNMSDKRVTLIE